MAPPRSVEWIETLTGTIDVLLPGKLESFEFGGLADASDLRRHRLSIREPVLLLERQAALAQGDQFRLGPAGVQAGEGILQVATHRHQLHRVPAECHVGRPANEKLTED